MICEFAKKHFKNSFVFVLFAFEIDETTEKRFSYFSDCSLFFSDRLDWINLIRTLPIYSALNTMADSHVLVLKSLFPATMEINQLLTTVLMAKPR
jgi:hypothetical protein